MHPITLREHEGLVETDHVEPPRRVPARGVSRGKNNEGAAPRPLPALVMSAPCDHIASGTSDHRKDPDDNGDTLEPLDETDKFLIATKNL